MGSRVRWQGSLLEGTQKARAVFRLYGLRAHAVLVHCTSWFATIRPRCGVARLPPDHLPVCSRTPIRVCSLQHCSSRCGCLCLCGGFRHAAWVGACQALFSGLQSRVGHVS